MTYEITRHEGKGRTSVKFDAREDATKLYMWIMTRISPPGVQRVTLYGELCQVLIYGKLKPIARLLEAWKATAGA